MAQRRFKKDLAIAARKVLERAVERNVPCEMQLRLASGELYVIKSRLLGVDEGGIEADWPTSIGQDIAIVAGMKFDVYFNLGDKRYGFSSKIVELLRTIVLNETARITGVVLAWPAGLSDGQRRNDHRVVLTGSNSSVHVHVADPACESGAAPLDAQRGQLRLVELSIGGLALIAPADWVSATTINQPLFARLDLGSYGEHTVLMEVRQRRALDRSTDVRVGMKFKSWPDRRAFERLQQAIQRYLVEVQRRRLKSA